MAARTGSVEWQLRNRTAERDALQETVDSLTAERDALAAFKKFVHDYLDSKGIPSFDPKPCPLCDGGKRADPTGLTECPDCGGKGEIYDGPHFAEGCRIGDRLDVVFAERTSLLAACRWLLSIRSACSRPGCCGAGECERCQEAARIEVMVGLRKAEVV